MSEELQKATSIQWEKILYKFLPILVIKPDRVNLQQSDVNNKTFNENELQIYFTFEISLIFI